MKTHWAGSRRASSGIQTQHDPWTGRGRQMLIVIAEVKSYSYINRLNSATEDRLFLANLIFYSLDTHSL